MIKIIRTTAAAASPVVAAAAATERRRRSRRKYEVEVNNHSKRETKYSETNK